MLAEKAHVYCDRSDCKHNQLCRHEMRCCMRYEEFNGANIHYVHIGSNGKCINYEEREEEDDGYAE